MRAERRRRALWPGAAAALLALAACARPGTETSAVETFAFEPVFATRSSAHGDERDQAVLRDAESWARWWADTTAGAAGAPPRVDFRAAAIIAVRDQVGPTSCYDASITRVERSSAGTWRVEVTRRVPGEREACRWESTHAAHAVAVFGAPGAVEFDWKSVIGGAR